MAMYFGKKRREFVNEVRELKAQVAKLERRCDALSQGKKRKI
jgi:hypothetical protein